MLSTANIYGECQIDRPPFSLDLKSAIDFSDGITFARIETSDGPVDGVFRRVRSSSRLVVLLPSAMSKPIFPFFPRWTWVKDIPENVWCVEEAVARKYGLIGGWFQGREYFHADVLAKVIHKMASALGITTHNVVLYGSSLGGFGALMIATRLPGCLAVVDVPQTNLVTYPFISQIKRMAQAIYGTDQLNDLAQAYPSRFSVIERFRSERIIPRIRLMHEVTDEPHGSSQIYPFLHDLPTLAKEIEQNLDVTAVIRVKGNGHAAADKVDVLAAITAPV